MFNEGLPQFMQPASVIADGHTDNLTVGQSHQCIAVTVLRLLELHQLGHHLAEVCQTIAFAAEMQAALIGHGHHNQSGNLCRLCFRSFLNINDHLIYCLVFSKGTA